MGKIIVWVSERGSKLRSQWANRYVVSNCLQAGLHPHQMRIYKLYYFVNFYSIVHCIPSTRDTERERRKKESLDMLRASSFNWLTHLTILLECRWSSRRVMIGKRTVQNAHKQIQQYSDILKTTVLQKLTGASKGSSTSKNFCIYMYRANGHMYNIFVRLFNCRYRCKSHTDTRECIQGSLREKLNYKLRQLVAIANG